MKSKRLESSLLTENLDPLPGTRWNPSLMSALYLTPIHLAITNAEQIKHARKILVVFE
jgi:hypothetical protein